MSSRELRSATKKRTTRSSKIQDDSTASSSNGVTPSKSTTKGKNPSTSLTPKAANPKKNDAYVFPAGFNLVILLTWQFPIIMTSIIYYPLYKNGYFECIGTGENGDDCIACHHSPVEIDFLPFDLPLPSIPISISGIIADNSFLQHTAYSSFLGIIVGINIYFHCLVPVHPSKVKLGSKSTTTALKSPSFTRQLIPSLLTCISFFFTLYVFPIRYACEQSWFDVGGHLGSLLASLGSGFWMLSSTKDKVLRGVSKKGESEIHKSERFFQNIYKVTMVISLSSAVLGCYHFVGRILFLIDEILMMLVFAGWITVNYCLSHRNL